MRIAVVGATGRSGQIVTALLIARGVEVIAVGRSQAKLDALPGVAARAVADCSDAPALASALASAERVVSCVEPHFALAVLAAVPEQAERVVLMGSTRKFTRFPDQKCKAVQEAEAALIRRGKDGVIVHPTMIYGAAGENNVQRIAGLIAKFGIIPLPDGGRCLIQPIHVEDVAACVVAAVLGPMPPTPSVVIAGPRAVTLREFVEAIARAMGRRVRVISLPARLMMLLAWGTRRLPGVPSVERAEVERLLEDKDFPIETMIETFGVMPRPLEEGLAFLAD